MVDPHGLRLRELAETVSGASGVLPRYVRRALASGQAIPGELGRLAELVAAGGTGVTEDDVRCLLDCGYSEDVVFECVVAAAVGAAVLRLRAVEELLASCRRGDPP
ncbi:MAG TPA: hypothetical protein VGJ13_02230 [Pseudonocardiaceae bacterium]|jgi:hypothetical protein